MSDPVPAGARALLEGAIDYAGLFPPAQLPMEAALANYARYRRAEEAWALGRFVTPVGRVREALEQAPAECLAVIGTGDAAADAAALEGLGIRVIEAATPNPAAVEARLAAHQDSQGAGAACYCEVDPGSERFGETTEAIRRLGGRAKLRSGGVKAEAIPPVERVLAFLERCLELELTCKATAGLHHACRGAYPLTYAADAPRATMHGYANLLLAAARLRAGGSAEEARAILEREGEAPRADAHGITWGRERWSLEEIRAGREFLVGFGSCSFEEPLEWLSHP